MKYSGGCHCGAVRFEIDAPTSVEVEDCNCSMCAKSGFLHLILPLEQFKLLSGDKELTTYSFNSKVAKHTFCRVCGIKPFYIPRSNPDGIDINLRCLDTQPEAIKIIQFDGQNWEQNVHQVAHKSQPRKTFD